MLEGVAIRRARVLGATDGDEGVAESESGLGRVGRLGGTERDGTLGVLERVNGAVHREVRRRTVSEDGGGHRRGRGRLIEGSCVQIRRERVIAATKRIVTLETASLAAGRGVDAGERNLVQKHHRYRVSGDANARVVCSARECVAKTRAEARARGRPTTVHLPASISLGRAETEQRK